MASYAYQHNLSADEHLDYSEEEELLESIEGRFEETKGRFLKSRERKTRLFLDRYLAEKHQEMLQKDLYDPDIDEV